MVLMLGLWPLARMYWMAWVPTYLQTKCYRKDQNRKLNSYMTRALIMEMLYLMPASAAPLELDWRLVLSSERKVTGTRFLRKLSRSFLKLGLMRPAKLVTILGAMEISGSMSTFRLGVKGSGSRMLRGKAERMRFLIWMQLGGITSQKP